MKYLLLVLLSLSLKAELDLTIPEQPAVYVSPKEFRRLQRASNKKSNDIFLDY